MNDIQIKEALTRMTRLSQRCPENVDHLKKALSAHLQKGALPALMVAMETGDPIGQVLAECLEESVDPELLIQVYERLPPESIALREVHLVIARKMNARSRYIDPNDWRFIAETAAVYSAALSDLGEREQALEPAQESACIYFRNLAYPDQQALRAYAVFAECLMQLGRKDDSLLVQSLIIETYRDQHHLSQEQIAEFANSLLSMSSYCRMWEKLADAINYATQADELITIVHTSPIEMLYLKHRIIRNLAECHELQDHLDQASELITGNLHIIRDLATHAPDRYTLELQNTLEALATIEGRLGNQNSEIALATEAISIIEGCWQQRPQAFGDAFASLLTNTGMIALTFGQFDKALNYMNQALDITAPLQAEFPNRFSPTLAAILNNRVEVLLSLHRFEEAVQDAHQALCLYRALKDEGINIAMVFNTLANARMQSGDVFRAQRSVRSAIRVYRRIVGHTPQCLVDMAQTLGTLAAIDEQIENYSEALAVADEALTIWDNVGPQIKEAHPQAYHQVAKVRLSCLIETEAFQDALMWSENVLTHTQDTPLLAPQLLADMLTLVAKLHDQMDNNSRAIQMQQEAVELLRALPIDSIPAHKVDLADTLGNLCFIQARHAPEKALFTAQQAIALYRELPQPLTPNMLTNFSLFLLNHGALANDNGNNALAIPSLQEALVYQRKIIKEFDVEPDDYLVILQTLAKAQAEEQDSGFLDTAKEIKAALGYFETTVETEELLENIEQLQKELFS